MLDILSRCFNVTRIDQTTEDFFSFELHFTVCGMQVSPSIQELVDYLDSRCATDRWEIQDREQMTGQSVRSDSSNWVNHLHTFCQEIGGDPIQVSFVIKKKVQKCRLNVYDTSAFSTFVSGITFLDQLRLVSAESPHLEILSVQSESPLLETKFFSPNEYATLEQRQQQRVRIYEQFGSFHQSNDYPFFPSDFCLTQKSGNKAIDLSFERYELIFIIAALANRATIKNQKLLAVFEGHKVVTFEIELSRLGTTNQIELWRSCFSWVYSSEPISDRLAMLRNIYSLDVLPRGILQDDFLQKVQGQYQLFLKDNSTTYIDIHHKIQTLLSSISEQAQRSADSFSHQFIAQFLASVTYFLSIVIGGNSNTGSSKFYFYLTPIIWLFFLAHYVISERQAQKDLDHLADRMTKSNFAFGALLDNYHFLKIFDEQYTPIIEHLRGKIKTYKLIWQWWVFLLFVATLIFLFFSFSPKTN